LKLEEILRAASSRVETVRVIRTAVNPLLWLVGLTTPLSLVSAILIEDRMIRIALLAFATLPIIVTIVAYFIFMFRDPDRLQSEEYRLRQRALQMLYKQGASAEIVDVAREIAQTESLPGGFGDGDKR
jgi:hypothetical protein